MDSFFTNLGFFASGFGLLLIGAIAALAILIWDWRASLAGLVVIQLGVCTMMVLVHNVVPQWAIVQVLVMLLCSLILALSGNQMETSRTLHQSGNWLMRVMALVMLIVSWRLFELEVPLPVLDGQIGLLFAWLAVCALLTLSLSDNPLFTGAALLLWFIPVQAVASLLVPIAGLIVIMGALELFLALATSYLILSEAYVVEEQEPVTITDITFPQKRPLLPSFHPADPYGDLAFTELPTLELPTLPPSATRTGDHRRVERTGEHPAVERTGEHPLVERLQRRRRTASSPSNGHSSASSTEPANDRTNSSDWTPATRKTSSRPSVTHAPNTPDESSPNSSGGA